MYRQFTAEEIANIEANRPTPTPKPITDTLRDVQLNSTSESSESSSTSHDVRVETQDNLRKKIEGPLIALGVGAVGTILMVNAAEAQAED